MSSSEGDDDYGYDSEEDVRTKKKAPKPKKMPAAAPLQPSSRANVPQQPRTIEETYQKKTQLEHVLLRPDTYIGSVQTHTSQLWVYEQGKMVHRDVTYVPGLYKIFDEILVNAADNKQRDPSMNAVKVRIDPEENSIQVWNNGKGVPVEVHAKEKVYVPELIFGHLLTSSNYDDTEQKTTGGRNGFGAKLANIYSTEFIIETADGERGKKYKQVFNNNMSKKSEPSITKCKKSENYTCITFKPDLARFKMQVMDQDIVALMSKRVVDIAGCLGKSVKVELNGTTVPVKSFVDYVGLYLDSAKHPDREEPLPKVYERVNDSWEVCVSLSDGQFQQVSFVNSINTIKGGTHVAQVTDQVAKFLLAKAQKKLGKANAANLKLHQVKNHLWIFVNALIVNPAFDSQTKETLNTRPADFGSTCKLPEEFLKKTLRTGIVESLLSFATFKANKDMKKTDGAKRQRLTGISKLDDANDAGGRNSEDCTLILTEGDSAKALAISGLSVVGRNKYGVFPLRGKLLNVRDASSKQIMDNTEISNIKQIMGLQQGKEYTNTKSLRYGHLMIMTDQDHDGSHIKGLIINFLHAFWPSLLKQPNFLLEFITPIIKASGPRNQVLSFYTMPEYEAWKESLGGSTKGWTIKYYKGLGTSTPKEAKEYFAALNRHRIGFYWNGDQDGDSIEMAFSKKRVEERKQWLRDFEPGTYLDQTASEINYTEFVNKELVLFSMADCQRSIPSAMDGLKPGQRKIIFSCFKRKLKSDVKVAQLAGYVSEHSAYHHGEQSLMNTIVGLAQDFVGSNNINLLVPSGQFGTRLQGGKDAASARYIYTRLHLLARTLFPEADDALLDFLNEDGQRIEPKWYLPILPTVLVNGSDGIGTGWSSQVPMYNPRDIVANLKRLTRGEPLQPMTPWFRGFKGSVDIAKEGEDGKFTSYSVSGIISKTSDTVLEITELPVGKWTQDYKEFLEPMLQGGGPGGEPFIKDMKEHHTDTSVHFELHLSPESMAAAESEGLMKKFKLTSSISTTNMHLFDKDGRIIKFDSPQQILEYFFPVRLEYYGRRKASMLDALRADLLRVDNRVRFILAVIDGSIVVNNRKKADLLQELMAKKYPSLPKGGAKGGVSAAAEAEDGDESDTSEDREGGGASTSSGGYEYLLGMPLWSLTMERVQQLLKEQQEKKDEFARLSATSPEQLWETDLDLFLERLQEVEVWEAEERAKAARVTKGKGKQQKMTSWKPKKTKRSSSSDEDDLGMDIDSDDSDFGPPSKAAKKAPAPKPAAAKPAAPKQAAPKPQAAKPKADVLEPKKAPEPVKRTSSDEDYDSADEFGGSLLDRLKLSRDAGDGKKAGKGLPQAKATKSAKAGAASKLAKGKADGMGSLTDYFAFDGEDDKPTASKKAKATGLKRKEAAPAKEDYFDLEDSEGEEQPSKKQLKKAAPAPARKPVEEAEPSRAASSRPARNAQKKPTYTVDDDEDDSRDEGSEFNDESDMD